MHPSQLMTHSLHSGWITSHSVIIECEIATCNLGVRNSLRFINFGSFIMIDIARHKTSVRKTRRTRNTTSSLLQKKRREKNNCVMQYHILPIPAEWMRARADFMRVPKSPCQCLGSIDFPIFRVRDHGINIFQCKEPQEPQTISMDIWNNYTLHCKSCKVA